VCVKIFNRSNKTCFTGHLSAKIQNVTKTKNSKYWVKESSSKRSTNNFWSHKSNIFQTQGTPIPSIISALITLQGPTLTNWLLTIFGEETSTVKTNDKLRPLIYSLIINGMRIKSSGTRSQGMRVFKKIWHKVCRLRSKQIVKKQPSWRCI
jgi:hypothetical protein